MESYNLDLYPAAGKIHLALFRNVRNTASLRERLLKGDPSLSYAFVDARMLLDPFQVLVAANKAVHDQQHNSLKTRTLYSEILYNLEPTSSISEALRKFGIKEDTDALVIAKIGKEADEEELKGVVEGELVPLAELDTFTDMNALKKCYKLGESINNKQEAISLILGAMAVKSF
ncbi:uncharacterized protein VTP21DRAFT_5721 [Calcarisporiella thermophila]|uniref:uncharacterized protein n=1 Tax=Calcarisporiella thermophila TaxID=911321 RepID=UPI003743A65D